MKRITAAALLSAGLLVSGCGRTVVVERVVEATTTTQYIPPVPETGDDAYINALVEQYPDVVNRMGRPTLIKFADLLCKEIDNGMTLEDLLLMSVEYGVDAEMLGFITASAVRNFCPHNQWFIDAAINA